MFSPGSFPVSSIRSVLCKSVLKSASFLILLSVLLFAPSLRGEEAATLVEPYATWERTANMAADVLEERTASTDALEELRKRLTEHRKAALEIADSGSVKVRTLEAQLEGLGPQPAEGESEPEQTATRRSELKKELAEASLPIVAAKEAYERANLLIAEVDSMVRERTTSKLLKRKPTPLLPANWLAAVDAVGDYCQRVARDLQEKFRHSAERDQLEAAVPSILFLVTLGIFLVVFVQRFATGRLLRAAESSSRSWRRWFLLISRNLSYLVVPGLGAASILMAISVSDVSVASTRSLIDAFPAMAAVFVVAHWLGHSLFVPVDPKQRLFGVDGRDGRRAFRLCQALGVLLAAELGLEAVEAGFSFPVEASSVLAGVVILVGSLLLWALAALIMRASSDQANSGPSAVEGSVGTSQFTKLLGRLMQTSAVLALIFGIVGFVGLAREALIPMIMSIGLVGLAYYIFRVVMAAIGIVAGRDYSAEDDEHSLLPFAIISLLSLALLPLIALVWGARTADIAEVWHLLIDGVKIGETRISLEAIIKLIVVFGLGLVLTRWFQKLLRTTVLPRTRLDLGGRTALVTGVGYVGLSLAAIVAVSAAGLNLSSLAVVAGALSIGVGFGLQTIVSNFVSGIILLIERPIKEGDWIEVSGYSGVVRKISVRSTRIETFDQHDVIVPNSDLIAGTVKNMTLSSQTGRLVVPVGVAYGSDLEATRRIMYAAATDNSMVMKEPDPKVMFMGLGESSLDFELRCYLHDVSAGVAARSDILLQIYNELGKAGIEIPFPQRDIHLRDIDRLIDAIVGRPVAPTASASVENRGSAGPKSSFGAG